MNVSLNLKWSEYRKNLLSNIVLPFSGGAFFVLETETVFGHFSGFSFAVAVCVLFVLCILKPSILQHVRPVRRWVSVYGIFSAAGTCGYGVWYGVFQYHGHLPVLLLLAVVSYPFVLTYTWAVLGFLSEHLDSIGILRHMTRAERLFYAFLFVLACTYIAFVYSRTEAFCGTDVLYDVIFNSDTPILSNPNACLFLSNIENDIRQPLFMPFASPVMGTGFLAGWPLSLIRPFFMPLAFGVLQMVLLLAAWIFLAYSMHLDSPRRMLLVAALCSTYPFLLFSLMMEQYVVAVFWMSFCILLYSNGERNVFAWTAATGTLLTSGILALPYLAGDCKTLFRQGKQSGRGRSFAALLLRMALVFLTLLLAFERFRLLENMFSSIAGLQHRFSGPDLTLADKWIQYSWFLRDIFFGVAGTVDTVSRDHVSWQPLLHAQISLTGVFLLAVTLFGLYSCRREKTVRLAGLWILMSFVLLFLCGWGTAENGLVLYSLYFGWAMVLLIFCAFDRLAGLLRHPGLVFVFVSGFAALCLFYSIPQIVECIRFGIRYYPMPR